MDIKKTLLFTSLAWILLISASFWWNYSNSKSARKQIALQTARGFFSQIVVTRQWNADLGRVYVPVTEKLRPNPYLDSPLRDIEVNENLKLTQINPAYMTRMLSEITSEYEGVLFHITSLKPIRPKNRPTELEAKFLKEFESGAKEFGLFVKNDDKDSFFYMAPLVTEKSCLVCHAKQGYSEGDIRGGISITMPFSLDVPLSPLLSAHLGIGLLGLLGIFFSGKKLDAAYNEIKKQAVFDSLTNIPNRRNFSDSIMRESKRSRRLNLPLSVVMCDIDNFKSFNDTYGHDKGDECLKQVAKNIEESLDRPGDFCARYGGEEFVIILPNTPLRGAQHIAEKIRLTIENMKIHHEKSSPLQTVTLSLGVATSHQADEISAKDLIKYADMALYRAKEKGKNRVESFSDVYGE